MQLQPLLSIIKDRKTHYIFCIKPNELKKANLFELPLVQHQIRYTNIMPLVNMWRTGYCFQLSHLQFLNRYKILSTETWPFYRIGSVIEGIATIIRELPLPAAEFMLGTTKVFMRSPRTVSSSLTFIYDFHFIVASIDEKINLLGIRNGRVSTQSTK